MDIIWLIFRVSQSSNLGSSQRDPPHISLKTEALCPYKAERFAVLGEPKTFLFIKKILRFNSGYVQLTSHNKGKETRA